jgi:asparagine synthetase B (glutamine-hydrolysing)
MCGFIFTNKIIKNLDYINYYLKFRGPDKIYQKKINDFNFIFNHLHITGMKIEQPFVCDNIVCMFNGEIYNYNDFKDLNNNNNFKSDGLCLIPLYQKYGTDFIKYLDGEFSILIIDFNSNIILFTKDIFGTKPLFLSIEKNNIGLSSYRSCLERLEFKNIINVESNQVYLYNLKNFEFIDKYQIYKFSLNQYKDSFDDWNKAFENSIKKRTENQKVLVTLSSGLDSGSICCALNKLKIDYLSRSIIGLEDKNILEKRSNLSNNSLIFNINKNSIEYRFSLYFNKKYVEPIYYVNTIIPKHKIFNAETKDVGGISLGILLHKNISKLKNTKILLSGVGGDEIYMMKKYDLNYGYGTLAEDYPENLNDIFPWKSFNGEWLHNYISLMDYIGAGHSLESRFPLLDKNVVQEFLYLKPELKKLYIKSPLYNYIKINNYPINDNKIGFIVK